MGTAPACHTDLAIIVLGEILFTAEGQLNGCARDLTCHINSHVDIVELQTVAKAAASVLVVYEYLVCLHVQPRRNAPSGLRVMSLFYKFRLFTD